MNKPFWSAKVYYACHPLFKDLPKVVSDGKEVIKYPRKGILR